jgi:hypothetical protein
MDVWKQSLMTTMRSKLCLPDGCQNNLTLTISRQKKCAKHFCSAMRMSSVVQLIFRRNVGTAQYVGTPESVMKMEVNGSHQWNSESTFCGQRHGDCLLLQYRGRILWFSAKRNTDDCRLLLLCIEKHRQACISNKRPSSQRKGIVLQQQNKLNCLKKQDRTFQHPAYNPYLAPIDFYLLSTWRLSFESKRLNTIGRLIRISVIFWRHLRKRIYSWI